MFNQVTAVVFFSVYLHNQFSSVFSKISRIFSKHYSNYSLNARERDVGH